MYNPIIEPNSPLINKVDTLSSQKSSVAMVNKSHILDAILKKKDSEPNDFKNTLNRSDFTKNTNPFYDNRKLSTKKFLGLYFKLRFLDKKYSSKCEKNRRKYTN